MIYIMHRAGAAKGRNDMGDIGDMMDDMQDEVCRKRKMAFI